MATLFSICAVIGCTLLMLQTLMQILGLSHDLGGDIGVDHAPAHGGADFSSDVDSPDAPDSSDHDLPDPGDVTVHHSGTALGRLVEFLSFQTIVAFLAFFGLIGLAAQQSGASNIGAGLAGMLAGGASMVIISKVLKLYRKLERDGTVRIARAVGCPGRVYLRIPGKNEGNGKVTIKIQGRTMEYKARTEGETIPTGASIVVTRVIDHQTLEVALQEAPVASSTMS